MNDLWTYAIGYRANFNYLHISTVLSNKGFPIHTKGVSTQRVFFILFFHG